MPATSWQSIPHVAERAPAGWKIQHEKQTGISLPEGFEPKENDNLPNDSPYARVYRRAWARLLSKDYEIDPMICPGSMGEQ